MKLIVPKVVNLGKLGEGKHHGIIQIQSTTSVVVTYVGASCGCTVPNVKTPFTMAENETRDIEFSASVGKVPWRKKLTIFTENNINYGVEIQID